MNSDTLPLSMYVLSSELKCVTISATSASDFTEYENALTMPKQQQQKKRKSNVIKNSLLWMFRCELVETAH